MLEPTERRLLLDALRPPSGYTLDAAVGTTFSLDLLALLTVPLAFTLFDWEDEQGRPMADPLALLEAVRRNADRMAIFCQAGKTYIPRHDQRLYAYLEPSVVDVKAPRANRAFHPKLWALSFHAPDAPTLVRVLCASRNLTFDRSWDTLLVLEGEVQPRQQAFERNLPLTTFLRALPDLAVQPAGDRIRLLVNQVQTEVGRTKFAPPPPFEDLRFLPLGLEQSGDEWPFVPRPQRLLVVSPFVGPGCLMRLVESNRNDVLVARGEELAKIAEILGRYGSVHVLLDGATAEPVDEPDELRINGADPSPTETTSAPGGDEDTPLVGLHAKLYVADDGPNARVWTGSANAGNAAFDGNVEFLVELRAKKSQCGIDSILNPENGAPSDRRERLLRSFLHNRAQVLRLLLLVLADEGADALGSLLATRNLVPEYADQPQTAGPVIALLEPLMRTLARGPAKLREIAQVLDELARSEDGRRLLPEGFEAIWKPIATARKEVEGW